MEQMINLRDLLIHEVQDLYSAEEQIIEALPTMIEKANNAQLKKALQDHLAVTEKQKDRLDKVKQLLGEEEEEEQKKGFFSKLFGGGKTKCKGTEGLIEEGKKMMSENMTTEVRDAAIIASAQKIEHYEICGYGTARAFARELNLADVAALLEETLNEEYDADDLLTDLAVGRLNEEAEKGTSNGRGRRISARGNEQKNGSAKDDSRVKSKNAPSKSTATKGGASKKPASKTASSKKSSPKRTPAPARKAGKSAKPVGKGSKKSARSKFR